MDGEMDEQMDDVEGGDADENGMDDDEEASDANGEKNEYVKKEYVAEPYDSPWLAQTISEVESFTIKNSRYVFLSRSS